MALMAMPDIVTIVSWSSFPEFIVFFGACCVPIVDCGAGVLPTSATTGENEGAERQWIGRGGRSRCRDAAADAARTTGPDVLDGV